MAGWRLILAPHKHDEARVETTHSHGAAKAACTDDESIGDDGSKRQLELACVHFVVITP